MTMVSYGGPSGMKARPAGAQSGMGSIIRAGLPVAGDRLDVAGQGMPKVDDFTDEVVAGDRRPSTRDGSPGGHFASTEGGIDGAQPDRLELRDRQRG